MRTIVSAGYREDPNRPKLLYHYTNGDGLLGIVNSKKLWATKIQYLNDISELRHAVSVGSPIFYQLERENSKALPVVRDFLEKLHDNFKLVVGFNMFVFSFCYARDRLSQWRGYCYDGGYALGFDPGVIDKLAKAQGFRFVKCIYDQMQQQHVIKSILEKGLTSFQEIAKGKEHPQRITGVIKDIIGNTLLELVSVSPQFKDWSFSEEEEYRLISEFGKVGTGSICCRNKENLLIPYCEFNLEMPGIEFEIDEIIVGPGLPIDLAMESVADLFNGSARKYGAISHTTIPYRKWG